MTFFARVYDLVRAIPRGRVATYGQIAALLGSPRAARSVGWALQALPEATDVPWQRVVDAAGRIPTGCRGHAAYVQAELLRREGVAFREDGMVCLERHRWAPTRLHFSSRRS